MFAGQSRKRIASIILSSVLLAWTGHGLASPAEAVEENLAELARKAGVGNSVLHRARKTRSWADRDISTAKRTDP